MRHTGCGRIKSCSNCFATTPSRPRSTSNLVRSLSFLSSFIVSRFELCPWFLRCARCPIREANFCGIGRYIETPSCLRRTGDRQG